MHRLRLGILGLFALAVLAAGCGSEGIPGASTPVGTPSASAPRTTPSATVDVRPEAAEPPSRRQWIPRGYSPRTYNRVVPPNVAAAIEEGDKYGTPVLTAQLEVAPSGGECVAAEAAELRASDWILDLARFAEDGILMLTPTYAEEVTDNVLLRARHIESGAEHLYEAERRALYDAEHERADGELLRYQVLPEFPLAGEWLVVVTHGPNWGCITLDVPVAVTRPFSFDVAAAEATGAEFPRAEGVPEREHLSFTDPPPLGTDRRACVLVKPDDTADNEQGIRSGEWAIEGWPSIFNLWNPSSSGKMPLVPYWQDEMVPPVLRLAREGTPALTVVHRHASGWAFGADGGPGTRFFPSSFTFAHAGTWLLVVESDPNWGCYVIDFPLWGRY